MKVEQLYHPNYIKKYLEYSVADGQNYLNNRQNEVLLILDNIKPSVNVDVFESFYEAYSYEGLLFVNYLSRLMTSILDNNFNILKNINIEYDYVKKEFAVKCYMHFDTNINGVALSTYELNFNEKVEYEVMHPFWGLPRANELPVKSESGYHFKCLEKLKEPLLGFPNYKVQELSLSTVLSLKEINSFLNSNKEISFLWLVGFFGCHDEMMGLKPKDMSIKEYISKNGVPIRKISNSCFEFGRAKSFTEIAHAKELDDYKLVNKIYTNTTLSDVDLLSYIESKLLYEELPKDKEISSNFKV